MSYTSGFTAVSGATFTAAQYNTNVRDNFSAIWVYTTPGDIAYATAANQLGRLAKGTALQLLRMNSGETAPEWWTLDINKVKADTFSNETSYSVTDLAATRDMPNSSKNITVDVTSTIVVVGIAVMYGQGTYGFFRPYFNINGVDVGAAYVSQHYYQINNYDTVTMIGIATGVPAGSRKIKIRETGGPGCTYTVDRKAWVALIIPE